MRSYGHYCGLARALDVVGDRWTLLIVRELLIRGPSRYTDLQHGLPGIATNMLVNRLREMEESGLVAREEVPPPTAATLFSLTPRGEALEDVIAAFGRWASPLMGDVRDDDETRIHWYALPVRLYYEDAAPSRPPVVVALDMGHGEALLVETGGDGLRTRVGPSDDADVTLEGTAGVIMSVLSRRLSLGSAKRRGLRVRGNPAALDRIRRRAV